MKNISLIYVLAMAFAFVSCDKNSKQQLKPEDVLVQDVLTKEQRDALTPDQIIQSFKEGNARFMNNDLTKRDHSAQVRKSVKGQYPQAVVLSCLDSRVPVEDVFDRGIGDIFVGRVAGNFVNEDLLGNMEFGCKVAGAKVIMVLGHEHCGAVKSAIDNLELGNITAMLSKIKPAVKKTTYQGEKSSKNEEYVHKVCQSNVEHTIEQIRKNSPILKEMEDKGEIKIVGGIYDMDTGKIDFL
ncbi:carbonic anhydrase family protein [Riemerella anatipestifer]|uniref:Carbonic anhydrase family protein n=1 Tax=Riemerella anatipestifer TaxID=34085 RepID=A0AAP3EWV8_RIEAN|nr:carbonic anhydrase family protein [Riemerella anatipestifer]AZZ58049.1 carbonic anhydrase [Riemerella anatipestifer]MBT0549101.1 carbonic anhydrase [Riemerella anatipestifer]MBT0556098.1 carbonic anhydrase [Riemerella anatipestifer]MBT0559864.1 carbonic anhydrase [Riemerella anatipestifer]MBT0572593.1 carbonic anhydrase [Riemerella anatipestifer]